MKYYEQRITYDDYQKAHEDPASGYNQTRESMVEQGIISRADRDNEKPISKSEFNKQYGERGVRLSAQEAKEKPSDKHAEISEKEAKEFFEENKGNK